MPHTACVSSNKPPNSGMKLLSLLLATASIGVAQTATVTYDLENVWLDPDSGSNQPMTGRFEWTYPVGDFDSGTGEFLALDLPWYGDGMDLEWTIESNQLEIVFPGNWHDWGVDISMKFTQSLSLDQPAYLDLALSKFEIETNGYNRKGTFISGAAVPSSPFTLYCMGDGTAEDCPCGNLSDPGQGCANSTGVGAVLIPGGSASVTSGDLTFTISNMVPGQATLLFVGDSPANLGMGQTLGDGLLCVGSGFDRLEVQVASFGGAATFGPGLQPMVDFLPGETRYFQAWYRDPGGPCATGSNLSGAVQVTFEG